MSGFRVVTSRGEEGVRVALRGELDLAGVPTLERELGAVEETAPPLLVLDLRGLTFIDSTGLRAVIAADDRARRQGRRLVLVPGPEPVQRVFRITGLDRRLAFVEEDAGGGSPR